MIFKVLLIFSKHQFEYGYPGYANKIQPYPSNASAFHSRHA